MVPLAAREMNVRLVLVALDASAGQGADLSVADWASCREAGRDSRRSASAGARELQAVLQGQPAQRRQVVQPMADRILPLAQGAGEPQVFAQG